MNEQTFNLLETFNGYLRHLEAKGVLILPLRIRNALVETSLLLEKNECEVRNK